MICEVRSRNMATKWNFCLTRKHSSRVRTVRLETVRATVSVAATRCHSPRGVSDVQWVGRGSRSLVQGAGGGEVSRSDVQGGHRSDVLVQGAVPSLMSNATCVMVTWGTSPPCEQTDTCENITLLQLCWRALKRFLQRYWCNSRSPCYSEVGLTRHHA